MKTKNRVLVVGSSNIDITAKMSRFPAPGETILDASISHDFGGKGANQAIAAKRAGSNVTFVTSFGDDSAANSYREFLRSETIALIGNVTPKSTGTAIIWVDKNGENSIAVASGANKYFPKRVIKKSLLQQNDVVVAQLEIPLATVTHTLRLATRAGKVTILNAAPAQAVPATTLKLVDILVVNATEAAMLCKKPILNLSHATTALITLKALGPKRVIITLGRKGAVSLDANTHVIRTKAFRTKTVDTTAAGDTFVGYLSSSLARGFNFEKALTLATCAAAISVEKQGAVTSIPHEHAVQIRLDRTTH